MPTKWRSYRDHRVCDVTSPMYTQRPTAVRHAINYKTATVLPSKMTQQTGSRLTRVIAHAQMHITQ